MVYDAPPPGNIEAIYVTVVSVDLVSTDGRILNVSNATKTFNLLDYTAGNPLELVNQVIPSGRYSQIRLKLSEDHTIKVGGVIKPLKTPSAEQSGLKLSGNFEITEGLLYSMSLHFDPNKSIVYNPGPDRYILKPVIDIVSNSLVDGPFTVSGLIRGERVVAELLPTGALRLITSAEPSVEMRGFYYFSYGTRILHLELSSVVCSTCTGAETLPGGIFYNLPKSDVMVSTWDTTQIQGTIGSGLLANAVSFQKTSAFVLDMTSGYSVVSITTSYPTGYNGKFGVLTLSPQGEGGRGFASVQQIQNQTATFLFKIPYSELPGGVPAGSRTYTAIPIVANQLTDLEISGKSGSVCGKIMLPAVNFALTVPVADKVLSTSVGFTPAL